MPLTQADIQAHYEREWKVQSDRADSASDLVYSSPVEDAVLYPEYERLLRDMNLEPNARRVLDVGSGSGRWVRFFLDRYKPATFLGIDYTASAVDLLKRWCAEAREGMGVDFRHANIADANLDFGGSFDLINIANVLFHIPEPELFEQSLLNLRRHLAPGGAIVTTEYFPRMTMRTNWMLVRSR